MHAPIAAIKALCLCKTIAALAATNCIRKSWYDWLAVVISTSETKTPGLLSLQGESDGGDDAKPIDCFGFRVGSANAAFADDMKNMPTNSADFKWGPTPPALPKGAEITVLSGDPFKDGSYVLRLKMPNGYKVPAHNHPATESVTVISGDFHVGMGDKLDENNAVKLTAGGYDEAPAKMNHYAWTSSPTVIQVHGQAPFAITYVNPADDPSKQ